jgi:hypothetical protein
MTRKTLDFFESLLFDIRKREKNLRQSKKLRYHKNAIKCNKCHTGMGHYMVKDDIWLKAVPNHHKLVKKDGHYNLCLDCLEKKLKRRLKSSDFTNAIINYDLLFMYTLGVRESVSLK